MKLPSVKNLPVAGKKVLLRTDYDVPLNPFDTSRIDKSLPTLKYLLEQKAKIIIISHLGRPEGKEVPSLSLKPIADYLNKVFPKAKDCYLHENLRFDPGEENNDPDFTKHLIVLADYYVNDAFAVSHRNHASIVGIPKFLPSAFGFSFIEEVEVLDKTRNNQKRPVTLILGGAKEDKLGGIEKLAKWADQILIGGRLPKIIENCKLKIENLRVAKLNASGKDISSESINDFIKIIRQSAVVVWAGPMGIYEEERFAKGTREIAQAIADSKAYSVVGGGDTEAALSKLGFNDKMSYISSGGGAMLEFLANGTLPGIEAIINQEYKMTE